MSLQSRLKPISVLIASALKSADMQGSRLSICSQEDDDFPVSFSSFIKVLQRPRKKRNLRSIQALASFVRGIKFFEQLALTLNDSAVTQCCLCMAYEARHKGEFVFHQGDIGTKFYILLEGACTVLVNVPGHESIAVEYYSRGDSFGELALLHNRPRSASILCTQNCDFGVLEKEDYTRILAKVHECTINKKADFLQSLPMFACWTRNSLQKLSYYFKERLIKRKQVLYAAGDPMDKVYFVKAGEMHIVQEVKVPLFSAHLPKFQTTKAQVAILGKGEWVGCEGILTSKTYLYTCICHSDTAELLVIGKDDFIKRANTEDTLKAIWELVRVKGELRKGQVESGKQVRLSENYTNSSFARSPPPTQETERRTFRSNIKTVASYPRLYPFKSTFREARNRPETAADTAFRRVKTWDKIIKLKSKPKTRTNPSNQSPKVVNIHTQSHPRLSEPAKSPKQAPFLSWEEEMWTGLTINSVERVTDDTPKSLSSRTTYSAYDRFRSKII